MNRAYSDSPFLRSARRWLRVLGPVGLFLVLGGPTPGSIGSCSDTEPFADYAEFCVVFNDIKCDRLRTNPPIEPCADAPGTRCFDPELCNPVNYQRDCRGGSWDTWNRGQSCDPPPTVENVNLCLQVISQFYDVTVDERTTPECEALCQ